MKRRPGGPGARREEGLALLLAVWLMTLLAVIAGEYLASVRVNAAAARNRVDDLRGLALARAGLNAAVAFLDDDIDRLSLDADGALSVRYKGGTEEVKAEQRDVALDGGAYSWRIRSEDGLVNLNTVTDARLGDLLKQCGLGPGVERDTIVDSVRDWKDDRRGHRINGAEEDYYRALDPPYSCKDGDFDTVEELLLVRGVREKPEVFFGGELDGEPVPGLRDLVTVHAGQPQPLWATAPPGVLAAFGKSAPQAGAPPPEASYYEIVATGRPGAGAPGRSLRAVVLRERDPSGESGDYTFTLVYYNDTYIPPQGGERDGH